MHLQRANGGYFKLEYISLKLVFYPTVSQVFIPYPILSNIMFPVMSKVLTIYPIKNQVLIYNTKN
jgi:hypothetical protein